MIPHSNDAISEETARYYAARAPEYDLSAGYLTLDAETLRVAKKKRYQQLFRGRDVLEIACGTGYWTAVLAETAKSVVGIDVNPEMISRAQSRCEHLPHVKFRLADAYSLGPEAGAFTAAFAVWWWSHIPRSRLREFLLSLHRRLIPGALVLFSDQLEYDVPRVDGMATQKARGFQRRYHRAAGSLGWTGVRHREEFPDRTGTRCRSEWLRIGHSVPGVA